MDIKSKFILSFCILFLLCVFQSYVNTREQFATDSKEQIEGYFEKLNRRGQKLNYYDNVSSSWKVAQSFKVTLTNDTPAKLTLEYTKIDGSVKSLINKFDKTTPMPTGIRTNLNLNPKTTLASIYKLTDYDEIFFYNTETKMWMYANNDGKYLAYIKAESPPSPIITTNTLTTVPIITTTTGVTNDKFDISTSKRVYIDTKELNKELMISWSKPDFYVGTGIFDRTKQKFNTDTDTDLSEHKYKKFNPFKFNKAELNYFIIIEKPSVQKSNSPSDKPEDTKFRVLKKASADKLINIVIDKTHLIGYNYIYVISQYINSYENNNITHETYSEPSNRIVFTIDERPDNQFRLFKKPDEHINKKDYADILNLLQVHINRKIPSVIEIK